LPVRIVQADSGASPCNPTRVIKDFGTVPANDDTFKARVNFKENRGDITTTEFTTADTTAPGSGSGGTGGTKILPKTGGALPALGVVGTLLVAGGLLIRRATR
jgi:LPXTG-motif cell wall-anchored protein